MLDFTKEELLLMSELMDEMYFGKFYATDECPKLYMKIQSLMDDYASLDKIRERTWQHGGVLR